MGDPKKKKKKYEKPKKLWDKKRIEDESALKAEFGLKNMRELWKAGTILRQIRREARRLSSKKGADLQTRSKQLLDRVKRYFIKKQEVTLDDVLTLTVRDILVRRLQSIVLKKGFARTMTQSRQFITHGHVQVNGRKVSAPSYLVKFDEEDTANWYRHAIVSTPTPKAAADEEAPKEAKEEKKDGREEGGENA